MNQNDNNIYGIGIESSCDDTGVALVQNGQQIIANPLYNQTELHSEYSGVVPELAGRTHLEKFPALFGEILKELEKRHIPLTKLSYVATTVRPGLVGSLLVGYYGARAIARAARVPLIPVHHLEAHLYAPMLEEKTIEWPALGLLLSGGNSALYHMKGPGDLTVIGDTLDDACGEALDKAASLLGLGYPGGPFMERAAAEFALQKTPQELEKLRRQNPLPKILKEQGSEKYRFSFSGIKTALYYYLQKEKSPEVGFLAWAFQERLFEIILRNTRHALENFGLKRLIAAGGVMANRELKKRLQELASQMGADFLSPSPALCTDNGAMVAAAGYLYHTHPEAPRQPDEVSPKNNFPRLEDLK